MDTGEICVPNEYLTTFFSIKIAKCLKRHGNVHPFHPVMLLLQNYSKEIIKRHFKIYCHPQIVFSEYLPVPDTMLRTGNTSLS